MRHKILFVNALVLIISSCCNSAWHHNKLEVFRTLKVSIAKGNSSAVFGYQRDELKLPITDERIVKGKVMNNCPKAICELKRSFKPLFATEQVTAKRQNTQIIRGSCSTHYENIFNQALQNLVWDSVPCPIAVKPVTRGS